MLYNMYFKYDIQLFGIPWIVAHQAACVHEILQARILEWVPSPGDLPNPGIRPGSFTLQADSLLSKPPGKPMIYIIYKQSPSMWVAFSFSFF